MPTRFPPLLAIWLLAFLLLSLLGQWLFPATLPLVKAGSAADAAWSVPQPAAPDVEAALSTITTARLLPAAALNLPTGLPAEEPSLTPPDWRIAAVFTRAGQGHAVLSVRGKPDLILAVGDSLPGGATLAAFSPDGLIIKLRGRRLLLSTYPE